MKTTLLVFQLKFWLFIFPQFLAEDANIRISLNQSFVEWAKKDVLGGVDMDFFLASKSWRYNQDFNAFMSYSKNGIVEIEGYSSPSIALSARTLTIKFDRIDMVMRYDLYYNPLWIPVFWGSGFNRFRFHGARFYLFYIAPSLEAPDGRLGHADIRLGGNNLRYEDVSWDYKNKYGEYFGEDFSAQDALKIFDREFATRLTSVNGHLYKSLKTINKQLRHMPSIHEIEELVSSNDELTSTSMSKIANGFRSKFFTNMRGSKMWYEIQTSDRNLFPKSDSWNDKNLPNDIIEVQLSGIRITPDESIQKMLMHKVLTDINGAVYERLLFTPAETGQSPRGSVSLATKDVKLHKVQTDDKNGNVIRELEWTFSVIGVENGQDFFDSASLHKKILTFYAEKPTMNSTETPRGLYQDWEAKCRLSQKSGQITPALKTPEAMSIVENYVSQLLEATASNCNLKHQKVWKINDIDGFQLNNLKTTWNIDENIMKVDIRAKL